MRKIFTLCALCLTAGLVWSQDIPEYCLENDAVHHFLNDFEYDSKDYTYTKITDYCDPVPYKYYKYDGYRKDQPNPVSIRLASALDTVSTIYVSENTDFSDAYTETIAKGVDSFDIYNLIPGRTYYYKVVYNKEDGTEVTSDSAVFKTTGHLRMLKIDNIFNVRDMGGWTGLGGHTIKYGKLFRGSRMTANGTAAPMITEEGKQAMLNAGIKADLDLRTGSEAQLSSSPLGKGVDYKRIENSYASRISTFAQADASIVGIQWIINELKKDKPVYFHCSVGADRTGTIAYLIGALCGMSEDALCKEFELTSFSADSVVTSGKIEDLRRIRTYDGRFDNNEESYKFAKMVDQIKAFSGNTLQRKVYNHLKEGVNGTKIAEADLNWLIKYLVDYTLVKRISLTSGTSCTLQPGETHQIVASITPADATVQKITFVSSDSNVATVSADGLVTAVRGGKATISLIADDIKRSMTVTVPMGESSMPGVVVSSEGLYYNPKSNLISNGSFEYGGYFTNWTAANEKSMNLDCFDIVNYEGADSVYVQSKSDGDETSANSIRTMWKIESGKTYVFGYRIKNSTDKQSVENPDISTSLTDIKSALNASGDDFLWDNDPDQIQETNSVEVEGARAPKVFAYPTYSGEWTEIQYVFTNTEGYQYLQVWFSHLSQAGNHTCLDNFYLSELEEATGVRSLKAVSSDVREYNISGQETHANSKGIIISEGKKYYHFK